MPFIRRRLLAALIAAGCLTAGQRAVAQPRPPNTPWWHTAVIYQVYPRSFQDTNGDGVGDLEGVTRRLDYLKDLGVGAIWLSPFFPSPMKDFGYDVSNYTGVDPRFGTLADFDALVKAAHARHMRILVDLVPNHTSDQHPWFLESRSSRTNPKRDWYLWRTPKPNGDPPNNWQSFFGGPAWTYDPHTGQSYEHLFLPEQPDLNYRNPAVRKAILGVIAWWMDRGVDGFRVDVMRGLYKDARMRDDDPNPHYDPGKGDRDRNLRTRSMNQPETHGFVHAMRALMDRYHDRVLVGETYAPYPELMKFYGTPAAPEAQLPFNFHLLEEGRPHWNAATVQGIVEAYEKALPPFAWPNWVLGNHDQSRLATVIGPAQARVAAMLLLTLRGTPTWYYGDELGMVDGTIPADRVQDPAALRQPGVHGQGRDPERTPMPWDGTALAGFSTHEPWLPLNADHATVNVASERQDAGSMLNLVRDLMHLRRRSALAEGRYASLPSPEGVFAYARTSPTDRVMVLLNFTAEPKTVDVPTASTIVRSTAGPGRAGEGTQFDLAPDEGLVLEDAKRR